MMMEIDTIASGNHFDSQLKFHSQRIRLWLTKCIIEMRRHPHIISYTGSHTHMISMLSIHKYSFWQIVESISLKSIDNDKLQ